jgi:hypothetical protein
MIKRKRINIVLDIEEGSEELDKQFYAATTIVASLLEGNLQNEDALVRRAYRIASILIKQQQ